MSLYYPTTQPTIAPSIMVRRVRRLPIPGDILARIGARVAPDDVVARAVLPEAPQILDVARALRVKPQDAAGLLRKPLGSSVVAGDVIAARRQGLRGTHQVKSPVSGTLTSYDEQTGQATIIPDGTPFELQANMDGIVTEHIPFRGVVIDTPAALVRGILGLGGEQHGVLKVAVTDPTEELTPDSITARLAYAVALGGGTTTAAALRLALAHNVRAVIVGSIPESELRAFLGYPDGLHGWSLGRAGWQFPPPPLSAIPQGPLPMTVVIVEGFGRAPMAARAWELLASFDGQEVSVDGTTRLRGGLARPEILVPLHHASGVAPFETTPPPLTVHSVVRLIAPPYLGRMGRVVMLSQGKQLLASGLTTVAAEVQLRDGAAVWVPVTNLEVIE